MFHDNGESIGLTEEQFFAEMERRKEKLHWKSGEVITGCPLCNSTPLPVKPRESVKTPSASQGGGQ
jgi:hypothetical protein